jgi:hypothetical protein
MPSRAQPSCSASAPIRCARPGSSRSQTPSSNNPPRSLFGGSEPSETRTGPKPTNGAPVVTNRGPAAPVALDLLAVASPGSVDRPFGESGVRVGSGTIRLEPVEGNLVMPSGASRVLFFFGPGFTSPYGYHPAELTIDGVAITLAPRGAAGLLRP